MRQVFSKMHSAYLRGRGIKIGKRCGISLLATLSREHGGHISIGDRTRVYPHARLECYGGNIRIGDHCTINPFCMLYGHGGLSIGNGVRIAAHAVIVPANHNFSNPAKPIYQQGLSCKGIAIEDDVWIGAGACILDGVTLRKGSIIGAGAVITKDTRSNGIYVGVPGKWIGERRQDQPDLPRAGVAPALSQGPWHLQGASNRG